jgi:mannosyltransferase
MRDATRRAALPAALVTGALSYLGGLGASSLFVDEVYSWLAARVPFDQVHDVVRANEVAPDTYYLGLHGWIAAFGDDEWVMRLPSAVAAVALVAAVWWLALPVAGRRAAVIAAGLCALSPLVLQYGQQVRAYVFAMLAVTLAAGAAVRHRFVWTLVLCVVAFWIHYTAGLVVAGLLVWLLARADVPAGRRIAGVGVAAALCALLAPLISHQTGLHSGGLEGLADFTLPNLEKVVGAPFDGRRPELLGPAALLCLVALVRARGTLRVLAVLAAVPLLAVIARTLAGADVLASRYVAVAAPLILVVVAGWAVTLPRAGRAVVVGALAVIALIGSVRSHLPDGRYADVRGVARYVARHAGPGEALAVSDAVGLTDFAYYGPRELPRGFPAYATSDPRAGRHRGVWVVTLERSDPPVTGGVSRRTFRAAADLVVTHVTRP